MYVKILIVLTRLTINFFIQILYSWIVGWISEEMQFDGSLNKVSKMICLVSTLCSVLLKCSFYCLWLTISLIIDWLSNRRVVGCCGILNYVLKLFCVIGLQFLLYTGFAFFFTNLLSMLDFLVRALYFYKIKA